MPFVLSGTTTTGANKLLAARPPQEFDSTLVARYKQSGLVIFGKTTTPELGLAPTTESAMYGLTSNPWNPERTAGGSSGGAAAIVVGASAPDGRTASR